MVGRSVGINQIRANLISEKIEGAEFKGWIGGLGQGLPGYPRFERLESRRLRGRGIGGRVACHVLEELLKRRQDRHGQANDKHPIDLQGSDPPEGRLCGRSSISRAPWDRALAWGIAATLVVYSGAGLYSHIALSIVTVT